MNDHDEAHLYDEGDMTEDDFRQYLADEARDTELVAAVEGGEVYRDTAGVLHRQGVPLTEDDAVFLEPMIDCPPGRTAHLNKTGRASAWRR